MANMLISVLVKKYYKMFHKQNTVQGSDTTMFNSSTSDGSIIKKCTLCKSMHFCVLFPLNSGWWLTADIVNHTVNSFYIIDDFVAHMR